MTTAPDRPRSCLWPPALTGLLGSVAVVVGSVLGGAAFMSVLPGAWFFGTPGTPLGSLPPAGRHPPLYAVLAVYGGMILLTGAWLGLLRLAGRSPRASLRRVLPVLALWAGPVMAAPPLFSRDVYSYAAQGQMVAQHLDPYLHGTGALGSSPFAVLAGPLWASTPSPYGPTFLGLDGLVTSLTHHNPVVDVVLLRLLALAGLALAAASLPTLARAAGRDPVQAVVLGVGSPLALTTLLGGAHNDALMAGLLLAGLALARRVGPVPGIIVCALAAGVKAPAALGVVFIAWSWTRGRGGPRARVVGVLGAMGISAATLEVVSAASGLGWGWLRTAWAPARITTGVTPVHAAAHVVSGVAHLLGFDLGLRSAEDPLAVLGMVVAGGTGVWLLVRSGEATLVRGLGCALLAGALLAPVLWAWYLSWGLLLLAPVAAGALRRGVLALSVAGAFVGVTAARALASRLIHAGAGPDALVGLGLLAAALVAYAGMSGRSRSPAPAPA